MKIRSDYFARKSALFVAHTFEKQLSELVCLARGEKLRKRTLRKRTSSSEVSASFSSRLGQSFVRSINKNRQLPS